MSMKTQTQAENATEFTPSNLSPGVQLRQAREQENLTKTDVAGRLHLRVCIIDAIEADDYTNTPELVFVRGYLRSYANLLGLSADHIIAAFNALDVKESRPERVLRQTKKAAAINKEMPLGWFSLLIIVGGLLLIALWWHSQQKTTPPVPTPAPVPVVNDVVVKQPQAPAIKPYKKSNIAKIPLPPSAPPAMPAKTLDKPAMR